MTCLSRVAMFLLVAASAATAGDDEFSRRSLKGLAGVYVMVEPLGAEAERDGLNKTSVQTDAELKLREAGITVQVVPVECTTFMKVVHSTGTT